MISYKRYFNSAFWKAKPAKGELFPGLSERNHIVLNSVRTGLLSVYDYLGFVPGDIVLIPAFAPHGLVLPAIKKRLNIVFYKLYDDLRPDNNFIEKEIEKHGTKIKAIILIHYFGFPVDFGQAFAMAKHNDILIFEDCAHTILQSFYLSETNKVGTQGDIVFFSLSKILPLPDGAIFISNNPSLDLSKIETKNSVVNSLCVSCNYLQLHLRSFEQRFRISILKKSFSILAAFFYLLYYQLLCVLNYASPISSLSQSLLKKLDIMELLNKRKANVGYVYNQIKICEGILYKSFFCESHITGIPFSGTNANVITAELKKKGINCLRYNKYWWFVPKELRETFKSEKEFHDNHFLVPVTENFNSETLDYLVKALKDLSPQME